MSADFHYEEEEFEAKFNGHILRRIYEQVIPHWRWMLGFMAAVGIVSVIDAYFQLLNKRIVDEVLIGGQHELLYGICLEYFVLFAFLALMVYTFIYLAGGLGNKVRYEMRQKVFNHLQTLSFSYFDRTPVGWIMSRVTSDTERMGELVTWGTLDVTWSVINITTAVIFMLSLNWQMTLIVLLLLPILIRIAVWFKTKILVQFRMVRKLNSKITGTYNENITGVRVVKALVREEENLKEFDLLTTDMYRAATRAAWLSALFFPVVQIISAFAIGTIVILGGQQVALGTLTVGTIQAFIGYVMFMFWPVQEMSRVYAEMQQAIASAERFFSLMDAKAEIVDTPHAQPAESLKGDIVFKDVNFYYSADKPVIPNMNLHIKQGETIALVGPTGGGKSTLVNLICRFYEPRSGTIEINGRDYRDYTLQSIHSRLGVVLQTPHLFSGTIRENLRYGRLDATNAEIEEAAQLAGAHEFIAALPKGYEEQVGEGGVLLSTGQKQLISLARAVLAKPDIFIMDEATSSVDTLTEALIQRGMEALMHRSTSFVIAHRLSTIRRATRIIVIENGRIAEMGTHGELIKAKGHYYNLYTTQFRHDLEVQFDPFAVKPQDNGQGHASPSTNGHNKIVAEESQ